MFGVEKIRKSLRLSTQFQVDLYKIFPFLKESLKLENEKKKGEFLNSSFLGK